jgi:histidinol-phosphate aminotransferase
LKIEKLARKGILEMKAYVPGRPIEEVEKQFKVKRWIKLASNENLAGPSPRALAAIRNELPSIHYYPEGPCTVLRKALALRHGLRQESVVISNGADNLILMLASAFVDEGDEVVMADPTFPVYTNATQIMGGKPVKVKLKNYHHDLSAMLKKVNRRTKLVFVCNPNNPTGTIVGRKALDQFLSQLPDHVIVILDEAYRDFAEDPSYPDGLDYVRKKKQLIVVRTFSKVYGLAGLRVGVAFGREDLIGCMYQVRDPFPVHRLAQVAAVAALSDQEHVKKSIRLVREGRHYLYRELDKLGMFYVPSHGNFVFVDFRKDSREMMQQLLKRGIIVRPGYLWNYLTFGRVTVGTMKDNRAFIKALREVRR